MGNLRLLKASSALFSCITACSSISLSRCLSLTWSYSVNIFRTRLSQLGSFSSSTISYTFCSLPGLLIDFLISSTSCKMSALPPPFIRDNLDDFDWFPSDAARGKSSDYRLIVFRPFIDGLAMKESLAREREFTLLFLLFIALYCCSAASWFCLAVLISSATSGYSVSMNS